MQVRQWLHQLKAGTKGSGGSGLQYNVPWTISQRRCQDCGRSLTAMLSSHFTHNLFRHLIYLYIFKIKIDRKIQIWLNKLGCNFECWKCWKMFCSIWFMDIYAEAFTMQTSHWVTVCLTIDSEVLFKCPLKKFIQFKHNLKTTSIVVRILPTTQKTDR